MSNKEIADKIYNTITGQKFADWYNPGGNFDKHIAGDIPVISKEQIIKDIEKLFELNKQN